MTSMNKIKAELKKINENVRVYYIGERPFSSGVRLDIVMNFLTDNMITRMLELRYDFLYVDTHSASKLRAVFDKLEKS